MIGQVAVEQDAAPADRKRLFVSLNVKLLVGFTLIFTVVFAGAYYWFYEFSTENALQAIKTDLTDTITGALAGLNGDHFQELVQQGSANGTNGQSTNAYYQEELQWFNQVHGLQPRAIPYSYIKGPDQNGRPTNYFIVDYLQINEPSKAAAFHEQWVVPEGSHSPEGLQQLSYAMTPYKDQWGTWVSAYAPIKNSAGQTVGALGVDFHAEYVTQVQQQILGQVGVAFGVTYAVLFVLVFLVSRFLTHPIRLLTKAAYLIGDGDYSSNLERLRRGWLHDEIAILSQVFDTMVAKVREREQSLVRKVEQLTVQIDEEKRKQDVKAIVDSDMFQQLQDRARMMRARAAERRS
ncbi:MAG: hypothetical protein JOZ39_06935 [Chloroflexi bacterium]|nr:hypothetical protein [Chloroflexota bacterium]